MEVGTLYWVFKECLSGAVTISFKYLFISDREKKKEKEHEQEGQKEGESGSEAHCTEHRNCFTQEPLE